MTNLKSTSFYNHENLQKENKLGLFWESIKLISSNARQLLIVSRMLGANSLDILVLYECCLGLSPLNRQLYMEHTSLSTS